MLNRPSLAIGECGRRIANFLKRAWLDEVATNKMFRLLNIFRLVVDLREPGGGEIERHQDIRRI